MSPLDDNLELVLMGDNISPNQERFLRNSINRVRRNWNELPRFKNNPPLEKVGTTRLSTNDLFKGLGNDLFRTKDCIIYLDKDLSKETIKYLTNNLMDELEAMLIDKYLVTIPQEKYIFDLSELDKDVVNYFMMGMDEKPGEFNYIIYGEFMGLWIYTPEEFRDTLI
jgi:hypothetical protein